MNKFKKIKQKVKDNKYKILTGVIFVAGVGYVIINQNNKIKLQDLKIAELKNTNDQQQNSIDILTHVMDGTVLASLKESVTRKLRYREGKLNNALMKNSGISLADETKLREEIAFFSNELDNIMKAEKLLADSVQRD